MKANGRAALDVGGVRLARRGPWMMSAGRACGDRRLGSRSGKMEREPPSSVPRSLSERGTRFLAPNNYSINAGLVVLLSALQLLAVLHYCFQTNRLVSRVIRWGTQNKRGQPRATGDCPSLCGSQSCTNWQQLRLHPIATTCNHLGSLTISVAAGVRPILLLC